MSYYDSLTTKEGVRNLLSEWGRLRREGSSSSRAVAMDLEHALNVCRLSPRQVEIVWLYFSEEWTQVEIAERYETSQQYVQKTLRIVVEQLVEIYTRWGKEEDDND